ncbi:CACTA en-spm transposon protein [Cucumis melo var. makuwa]|uniref:CACTA en-spm transposon protein n=1 Tax=Cucumis melo var. makuwa TaxID=1194695 RepID=A0A5D3E3F4_CUCMM|nr:CACTA en-spm transposon protein [Cucumis melo var. makuwa]
MKRRGETLSRHCCCPRCHERVVVPLPPSATAHPYLRGGSRIACKVSLLKGVDQFFQLYATLLWTINDFPTYGDLSWWSKKGYQACPICMGDRSSFRIQEVDNVENEHLNVLEIVVSHQVDEHIEDDTLCKINVDSTIVDCTISSFPYAFLETEGHHWWATIRASLIMETCAVSTLKVGAAISVCVRKTFLIRCLKWADVGREYFEIVKGDLQHFKKYSDPEEADANPPYLLVGSDDDCHYLCDHYMSRAFKFLNLLQHQMLELQSQPTSEGNQPLFGDEIWETVLDRRSGYSKSHGWGPKPKAYKMTIASSSTMSCLQSRVYSRALITC